MKHDIKDVLDKIKPIDKVLDVGGWSIPLRRANYVLDICPYETRSKDGSLGQGKEMFSKDTWIVQDVCSIEPFPFKDKEFDFVFCSHLLEDVRDPARVCQEMIRIGKGGYIETPSRAIESKKGVAGRWRVFKNLVGYYFHRWFIEDINGELVFTPKSQLIQVLNDFQIKSEVKSDVLRFFWNDSFKFKTILYPDLRFILEDLLRFKSKECSQREIERLRKKIDYLLKKRIKLIIRDKISYEIRKIKK